MKKMAQRNRVVSVVTGKNQLYIKTKKVPRCRIMQNKLVCIRFILLLQRSVMSIRFIRFHIVIFKCSDSQNIRTKSADIQWGIN